jgi:hypothetical protein
LERALAKKTAVKFDEYLLGDRFFPLTSSIGFLKCDRDVAVDAFVKWSDGLGRKPKSTLLHANLPDALLSLCPLQSWDGRVLFVPCASDWTAVFVNCMARGRDDDGPSSYLASDLLKCLCVLMCAVPDTRVGKYPNSSGRFLRTRLRIVDPAAAPPPLHDMRTIELRDDSLLVSNWTFKTEGAPLPFEDLNAYEAKFKRDKFPLALLDQYLQVFGIRAFDESFYLPAQRGAVLVDCDYIGNCNAPNPKTLDDGQFETEGRVFYKDE